MLIKIADMMSILPISSLAAIRHALPTESSGYTLRDIADQMVLWLPVLIITNGNSHHVLPLHGLVHSTADYLLAISGNQNAIQSSVVEVEQCRAHTKQ